MLKIYQHSECTHHEKIEQFQPEIKIAFNDYPKSKINTHKSVLTQRNVEPVSK